LSFSLIFDKPTTSNPS